METSLRRYKHQFLLKLSIIIVLLQVFSLHAGGWSWNNANSIVTPEGDIKLKMQSFVFEKGDIVRYIDYENGNDSSIGTKQSPWKHHPWDKNAKANAASSKGAITYVFKRGVTYRGELVCEESGDVGKPIRLTSEPGWGTGEAVLAGSEAIAAGWIKGADNANIPDPDKVWYIDIPFNPRTVWQIKDGKSIRIPLARTPNWKISNMDDVKSEWYHWDNPGKHFGNTVDVNGKKMHKAYDTKNINKSEDYYKGATVWTEWAWVMGTPYPTPVEFVDVEKKALGFSGQWGGGTGGEIIRYNRYYLEDKPHYLDDPDGEFWFDKKGKQGGRLYIRLADNQDPNTAHIEVGSRLYMIKSKDMSNISISGLSFRFSNAFWNLTAGSWAGDDVAPGCIYLKGSGNHITIKNCVFDNVHLPVKMHAHEASDEIDNVLITDNQVHYTDHGVFHIMDGGGWNKKSSELGRVYDVKILRNNVSMVGMRPDRYGQGHAISVICAETLEVSGNIIDSCWASGIFVYGAKQSASTADRPLSRILIHHNKVTNSMLNSNDWGGIETWQGGPAYVYNNISGNPGGYWNWKFRNHPDEPASARFGHAYYLDGAFKNYHFNNIAWGKSKDPFSQFGNTSAFQEIHSYQNTFFNNTVYNFVIGSRRQAPHAGRNKYLGNIWSGIGHRLFRHSTPAKTVADANAADAGEQKEVFFYESNAYAGNVFYDIAEYGVYDTSGRWLKDFSDYKNMLISTKSMQADLGIEVSEEPLKDPAKHDFRPKMIKGVINDGAKVFVPWGLYAMVGEWNFYHSGDDPTRIIDEHWYMTPEYTDRQQYSEKQMFPLKGVNISADDYVQGPLENWINGSLKLNGKDQYAVLFNKDIDIVSAAEPEVKIVQSDVSWVKIDAPEDCEVGKPIKIKLYPQGLKKGNFLHCDLHWTKSDGSWGGFNASSKAQQIDDSESYDFRLISKDKPNLGTFSLMVYESEKGTWKSKTETTSQTILVKKFHSEREGVASPSIDKDSFIIEVVFKADIGVADAVLVEKMQNTGYSISINKEGKLLFSAGNVKLTTQESINDGKWHHIIAEADRDRKVFSLYIDGKKVAEGIGIDYNNSLKNSSDLYVGGTPDGRCLKGELEFLRISLGTFKHAKTSIDELYNWQFNGPQFSDLTGKRSDSGKRAAGALDF